MNTKEQFDNALENLAGDENVFSLFAATNNGVYSSASGTPEMVTTLLAVGIKSIASQIGMNENQFLMMVCVAMNTEDIDVEEVTDDNKEETVNE